MWLLLTAMTHYSCADAKLQSDLDPGVGLTDGIEDPSFCKAVLVFTFIFKCSEVQSLCPFS